MDYEIKNLSIEKLCGNWSKLKKVTFEYLNNDGDWEHQQEKFTTGETEQLFCCIIKTTTP